MQLYDIMCMATLQYLLCKFNMVAKVSPPPHVQDNNENGPKPKMLMKKRILSCLF